MSVRTIIAIVGYIMIAATIFHLIEDSNQISLARAVFLIVAVSLIMFNQR